jgi:hypothetical protein
LQDFPGKGFTYKATGVRPDCVRFYALHVVLTTDMKSRIASCDQPVFSLRASRCRELQFLLNGCRALGVKTQLSKAMSQSRQLHYA